MRVVVTGGAGFLGSHLVDRFLARGDQAIVVDNFVTGDRRNLPTSDLLTLIEQDATEYLAIEGPIDRVLHFASPASPDDFRRRPIQVLKAGALGTHKALGLAKAKGARFLLASTSEVYGDPLVTPQNEEYWGNVNPIGPRAVYDEAKRYAEAMTMAYRDYHGVDTRIIRLFNTYGPRMRLDDGRVVPNFVRQALLGEPITVYGDGSHTRSFGFVDDILDGVLLLLDSDYREPVNIGSTDERTVLEFAELVREMADSRSEIVFQAAAVDDPKRRRPDLTRAETVLGWRPTTSLEVGLRRTLAFFKESLATRG